jgi:hypothetical protein
VTRRHFSVHHNVKARSHNILYRAEKVAPDYLAKWSVTFEYKASGRSKELNDHVITTRCLLNTMTYQIIRKEEKSKGMGDEYVNSKYKI